MAASTNTTPLPFGGGRVLVEIVDWDARLYVGLPPASMPAEERVQGLFYNRGFEIEGRIIALREIEGDRLLIWSLLMKPGLDLADGGQDDNVGRLHDLRADPKRSCFGASLILPENGLPIVLAGLASCWRYVHIWTRETVGEPKSIRDFWFSRLIPPRLNDGPEEDSP